MAASLTPAMHVAQAAATASCASGSVTTVPFTYLVAHWTTGSVGCATAAAQVDTATIPQTDVVHYVPSTYLVQQWG